MKMFDLKIEIQKTNAMSACRVDKLYKTNNNFQKDALPRILTSKFRMDPGMGKSKTPGKATFDRDIGETSTPKNDKIQGDINKSKDTVEIRPIQDILQDE